MPTGVEFILGTFGAGAHSVGCKSAVNLNTKLWKLSKKRKKAGRMKCATNRHIPK